MTLAIQSVTVAFDGRRVLNDISLTVERGEVVGLLGPNGSGKSTLLRCAYRVLRPDDGQVRVDGDDVSDLRPPELARRLAVVPQEQQLDFDLSVAEVVGLGLLGRRGLGSTAGGPAAELVAGALRKVELIHLSDRAFPSLSGGEKQRALIARAVVQDAPHLILDEPTNHLDIRHQLAVLALVRGPDRAVLAALHDLNVAHTFCDRVLVLSEGVVVASGPPDDVLTTELVGRVYGVDAAPVTHPDTRTRQLLFRPLADGRTAEPTGGSGRARPDDRDHHPAELNVPEQQGDGVR